MEASQCVTWQLWTQVNASPGRYGRNSMRHLVARDASQWAIWLLWTQVNASPDC